MASTSKGKKKATRQQLDLKMKNKIFELFDKGLSQTEIRRELNLKNKSTVCTILSKRGKTEKEIQHGRKLKSVKCRRAAHEDLEKKVLKWVTDLRNDNVEIESVLVMEKAKEFALELDIQDFKASDKWYRNFRTRNELRIGNLHGEKQSADTESAEAWLKSERVQNVLSRFEPKNVYNLDESALFYKMRPSRSLLTKFDNNSGSKKEKARITVLLVCNSNGTDKQKPLIINNAMKPRCFRNKPVKIDSLPVIYKANKKAWMTGDIFTEYMSNLNKQMKKENRKILMLLDNFSGHLNLTLSNIELLFLPPNTTSILQPYILQAVQLVISAWNAVTEKTISNCFAHSEIIKSPILENDLEVTNGDEVLNEYASYNKDAIGISFDEFVEIDSSVAIGPVNEFDEEDGEVITINEQNDDGDDGEEDIQLISRNVALLHLHELKSYLCKFDDTPDQLFAALSLVENNITNPSKLKQTTIESYFKPGNN